ncbi:MAG: ADP-forming succinate--CoA ligase subunit beta [Proteobacteria bacterium]|nr:MAG: ADP-forming succinate--CoA ligase subunit beta [Pseudomonadota bacterium]PIE17825.1 MAG: ADP-forming succinate--CoA ligase subunit beta [Pseudomonadota bacterium]
MKIHEYQAKELLKKYGVPVPLSTPILECTPEKVKNAAAALIKESGTEVIVVKAQIHAGGRGKGRYKEDPELGGVKVVKGANEAAEIATRMMGKTLVTIQTGDEGKRVDRLLLEQGIDIDRELYLSAVLDRAAQRICVMACEEGGVEIEEVAARTPEKILKAWVDPVNGLSAYQARQLAFGLGLSGKAVGSAVKFLQALATAFDAEDATLAEINPLVVTKQGEVMALDAKINLDDNASQRHPYWRDLRDDSEEDPAELEAHKHDLSYVNLDGTIGCMVNGAGLAMATMDIIKEFGASPANFLDVGGTADKERVAAAFKIIVADPNVKGIFINIFGGIVHCDRVAQGVIDAVKEVGLKLPLVVRLEGTNVDEGKRLLAESDLAVTPADDMADGAKTIVEAAK